LEGGISKRNLGDPHCAQQMCPFHCCCLLEGTIYIWAEYTTLNNQQDSCEVRKGQTRTGSSLTGVPRPTS
jgi:hypothetical protein